MSTTREKYPALTSYFGEKYVEEMHAAVLHENDVDYITGGPSQGRSKYQSEATSDYSAITRRRRREVMVEFLTAVPIDLHHQIREHSERTGESIRDLTTRSLRYMLANSFDPREGR